MSKAELDISLENLNRTEYKFRVPGTLIFMTGVPLSGKSTLAPLIASSIESCSLQNMDIVRLLAQEMENLKPERQRNRFVTKGSCDSYTLINDGLYTPSRLVEGFLAYSEAVTSLLDKVIPGLEAQGAQQVLFEGVQLTPNLVSEYLSKNNFLIIVTSSSDKLKDNADKVFTGNNELLARYSPDKLLILQQELINQARELPSNKVLVVDNSADYLDSERFIIQGLLKLGIVERQQYG